ncbi:patatin-like phospholipase family protein [Actinomadura fulvescens]|uniref:patatin-like phospholipase family protein n=1 Tax=Actinomadura fulvescens TaxID=46160 RepID=UPI0031D67E63
MAVVLGPGGPVGTAWLLGLAAGLRREGADLARADLLVGTSAGAIAGAAVAIGRDLEALVDLPPVRPGERAGDLTVMPRVLEILNMPGVDRREALRQVGALAREADALPEERHLAAMEHLVGTHTWPDTPLLVTAVDTDSGEPVVWNRDSGVPLHAAVASSSAAPGYAAPITIGGRRYMDGGLGAGSNVHLADGAGTLILIEPIGHLFPAAPIEADVRVTPDPAALEAFGPDLADRSRWAQVHKAGQRQSTDIADRIRSLLPQRWT